MCVCVCVCVCACVRACASAVCSPSGNFCWKLHLFLCIYSAPAPDEPCMMLLGRSNATVITGFCSSWLGWISPVAWIVLTYFPLVTGVWILLKKKNSSRCQWLWLSAHSQSEFAGMYQSIQNQTNPADPGQTALCKGPWLAMRTPSSHTQWFSRGRALNHKLKKMKMKFLSCSAVLGIISGVSWEACWMRRWKFCLKLQPLKVEEENVDTVC